MPDDMIQNQPSPINLGIDHIAPAVVVSKPTDTGQYESSVTTADQTQESRNKQVPYEAALPLLALPLNNQGLQVSKINVEELALVLKQQSQAIQDIMNNMLDAWVKNIQQIADETRAMLNSPAYQAKQEAKNGAVVGTYTSMQRHLQSISPASLIAMIAGGVSLAGGMAIVNSTPALVSSVNGAIAQGVMIAGVQSANMSAELGLLGAMMILPMVSPLGLQSLAGAIVGKSGNFANDFANGILPLLNLKDNTIMSSTVNQLANANSLTADQKTQLAAQIKMILGFVALSVLYMHATGKGVDGDALQNMLNGKLPDELAYNPNAMNLISSIKENLQLIPEDTATNSMSAMFNYLSTITDPQQLTNPASALQGVANFLQLPVDTKQA